MPPALNSWGVWAVLKHYTHTHMYTHTYTHIHTHQIHTHTRTHSRSSHWTIFHLSASVSVECDGFVTNSIFKFVCLWCVCVCGVCVFVVCVCVWLSVPHLLNEDCPLKGGSIKSQRLLFPLRHSKQTEAASLRSRQRAYDRTLQECHSPVTHAALWLQTNTVTDNKRSTFPFSLVVKANVSFVVVAAARFIPDYIGWDQFGICHLSSKGEFNKLVISRQS